MTMTTEMIMWRDTRKQWHGGGNKSSASVGGSRSCSVSAATAIGQSVTDAAGLLAAASLVCPPSGDGKQRRNCPASCHCCRGDRGRGDRGAARCMQLSSCPVFRSRMSNVDRLSVSARLFSSGFSALRLDTCPEQKTGSFCWILTARRYGAG